MATIHKISINVINDLLTDKWLLVLEKIFNDSELKDFADSFSDDFLELFHKRVKEQTIETYGQRNDYDI